MLGNVFIDNKNFEFTLKLNTFDFTEDMANALFESGCDDALLNSNANGVYLDFCRESGSLSQAISSAIEDVKKAGFEATLYEEVSRHAQF